MMDAAKKIALLTRLAVLMKRPIAKLPPVFFSEDLRPLEIGTKDKLIKLIKKAHQPIPGETVVERRRYREKLRTDLNAILTEWCSDPAYCQTVLEGKKRYDLSGKPVQKITKSDRQYAQGCLEAPD